MSWQVEFGEGTCGLRSLHVFIEHIVPSLLFKRLLSEVGQLLGIPTLAPGNEEVCQLAFDGRHLLQIVHVEGRDHILLSCPVGSGEITAEQAIFAASSNFMQAAGGAVACAAPDGRLVLQFGMPTESCQASTLLSAMERLLDEVEGWETKLSSSSARSDVMRHDMALQLHSA